MQISNTGIMALIKAEGERKKVYTDIAGYQTIGVGHKLTKEELETGIITIIGRTVHWKDGLTSSDVLNLCHQDLVPVEEWIKNNVKVKLTQGQFDALVMFTFNIGIHAFITSTLLKVLNKGQYNLVPEQLLRWVHAGGKVSTGLTNRRTAEILLWNS
jgi:lysozyme